MSGSRRELHVTQQTRREKLRSHHSQEFPNSIAQVVSPPSSHPTVAGFSNNLDLVQVRNVRNNGGHNNNNNNMLDDDDAAAAAAAAFYSSEMINFSTPPPSNPRNTLECQELVESTRLMMPPPPPTQYSSLFPQYSSSNIIHSSPKEDWRNSNPHQQVSSDWMVNNYGSSSSNFLASEFNNNVSSSTQKQLGEMQYPSSSTSSPPLYHNALQDIFKSPSSINNPHGTDQMACNSLMHHEYVHYGHLWPLSSDCNNPPHQGLCLSLSSISSQSKPHFEEGSASDNNVKPSSHHHQDPGGILVPSTSSTTATYKTIGPLGPFTGYATILKSSRFLKPCQQLLDEYCCQKSDKSPKWVSRENYSADESAGVGAAAKCGGGGGGCNSGSGDGGGGKSSSSFCVSSSSSVSASRPECQKNKAKLLYMQEEVTRRYKQYHQQMQMVVSSFDSVAGLSSATPYISLALKSVSKHFRCLKIAISDQLKLTCEVLGEEFSMPNTSNSSKIVDNNSMAIRLRCNMDQSFQKKKSSMDFLESQQQHVWRPQRGLPERAVAILKAWLFEHFLHPYPTDTDKHMLATQTGLSRNQVSNWFINARVRVWKPMVEEIHMLETKGTAETRQNQNTSQTEGVLASEGNNNQRVSNKFGNTTHHAIIPEKQFQRLEMGSSSAVEKGTDHDEEQCWNQEKRSKYDCEIAPPSIDGSTVMGFMPYRRGGGLDVGPGLGPVSLTLGLRHGVEGAQHQQQQLQHEEELRRQFGGHMIHDFVG